MRTCFVILFAIANVSYAESSADSPAGQMLEGAIQAYTDALELTEPEARLERFTRSQRMMQQFIAERQIANADLYFNLGNAALGAQQVGRAILAFRRALQIDPGHGKAQRNLDHVRAMLPGWIPQPQSRTLLNTFFFWHQMLSRSGRALVAALCFAAAAVFSAIALRWRRRWARAAAVLPAVAWVVMIAFGLWTHWSNSGEEAVVTAPETIARAADSQGAPPKFAEPIPAGTELVITRYRSDWAQVRLADGRDAWVRKSALTEVNDLFTF